MRFSIIMPSLLSDYPGSATGKDKKLVRAIQSVLDQSFTDWELIIIADGCKLTEFIVANIIKVKFPKIKLLRVERKRLFSNEPRNKGINEAQGEYIIYLDNDDYYGKDHLKKIDSELGDFDWVYADDMVYNGVKWGIRETDVTQYGRCGTSNLCHARKLDLRWIEEGYGHDFFFIQKLREFKNFKHISAGEYHVCHFQGDKA